MHSFSWKKTLSRTGCQHVKMPRPLWWSSLAPSMDRQGAPQQGELDSQSVDQVQPAACFLKVKFYWNTATPIGLRIACGFFSSTKAKLNSFNRNCTIKPKLFAISPITRNVHSHLVQTNFICIYKSTVVFRRSIIQGQRVNSKDSVRPILCLHPASQHSFAHI